MWAIKMPQVGQDIPAARIVEWKKQAGDAVQKGEVIAVVESEKATFEVQAEQAGVLLKIEVPAGEEGEVFMPMAWMGQPGEEKRERRNGCTDEWMSGVGEEARPATSSSSTNSPIQTPCFRTEAPQRQFASPSARRAAREHGVDLSAVKGSGPGGRIQKDDVLSAAAALKPGHQQNASRNHLAAG